MRIVAICIFVSINLLVHAQIDFEDISGITDGATETASIDAVIKLKANDKVQHSLLIDFKNKFGMHDKISVVEFEQYYELTVTHPDGKELTGGAECYKLDKQTGEREMLWHEHPMEAAHLEVDVLYNEPYVSDFGHKITLRMSEDGDLYIVEVLLNSGVKRRFVVAESQYMASHTHILWDNEDFIFVRYTCGTECWGGQLLPLNSEGSIQIFKEYIYTDKDKSIVVYPDTDDGMVFHVENLKTKETISKKLNLCNEGTTPAQMVEKVYFVEDTLIITYIDDDCASFSSEITPMKF